MCVEYSLNEGEFSFFDVSRRLAKLRCNTQYQSSFFTKKILINRQLYLSCYYIFPSGWWISRARNLRYRRHFLNEILRPVEKLGCGIFFFLPWRIVFPCLHRKREKNSTLSEEQKDFSKGQIHTETSNARKKQRDYADVPRVCPYIFLCARCAWDTNASLRAHGSDTNSLRNIPGLLRFARPIFVDAISQCRSLDVVDWYSNRAGFLSERIEEIRR